MVHGLRLFTSKSTQINCVTRTGIDLMQYLML